MVETNLTEEMKQAGGEIVRIMDEHGIQPDAAFWFYYPEQQIWKLVIAQVKMTKSGPKELYRQIQKFMSILPKEISQLSLEDISLVRPDAPMVVLLRKAVHTGSGIENIRLRNNVINGTLIEDAYVYRLT